MGTQLRHGGDVLGLIDSLDYIQGMGVKAVYLAGSAFINLPWASDGERLLVLSNGSCANLYFSQGTPLLTSPISTTTSGPSRIGAQ